uniref:Uncharacterized protein n=1 Tax=Tetradesmus obliquus TaxID=3088 RepID=A0A383WD10_TETOB|eukprot:jgi/Sobl393_1/4504/SZX75082.1
MAGGSASLACRAAPDDSSSAASISAGEPLAVLPAPPAAAAAAAVGPAWQPQDILKATTADGTTLFMEVISTPAASGTQANSDQQQQQQPIVAHQGVLYAVQQTQQHLLLLPQGWQLQPEQQLVKALPGWPAALQQLQAKQRLPQQPLQLQSAAVVSSAAQLQAAVQRNPALWRDGTGPSDPPLQGLQYQTLAAGEVESLLSRARGLVMVQLVVGWDAGVPQPVYNPLLLHSLGRALRDADVSIFMSKAAGGLGLTAILCAKAEPWRAWGAHLAGFGAQAALVADSAYYKLLIGRMLGYKEGHIHAHIQATSGRLQPTPEVVAAVDKDMAKISRKKPQLPWSASSAAGGSKAGGSKAGGRKQQQPQQQQQQLPRSARKKR